MDIIDKNKSYVWNHFIPLKNKGQCKYCSALIITVGGSVGNLSRHLSNKHPTVDIQKKTRILQLRINNEPNSNEPEILEYEAEEATEDIEIEMRDDIEIETEERCDDIEVEAEMREDVEVEDEVGSVYIWAPSSPPSTTTTTNIPETSPCTVCPEKTPIRNTDRRTSFIWNHFTPLKNKGECNYCCAQISMLGGSLSNLSRHLKKKHPSVDLQKKTRVMKPKIKSLPKESDDLTKSPIYMWPHSLMPTSKHSPPSDSQLEMVTNISTPNLMRRKKSNIWNHFMPLENKGQCNYCFSQISMLGGSVSNLGRHLRKKHPTVEIDKKAQIMPLNNDNEQTTEVIEYDPETRDEMEMESVFILPSTTVTTSTPALHKPSTPPIVTKSEIVMSSTPVSLNTNPNNQTSFFELLKPIPLKKSTLIDRQLLKMVCKGFHSFSLVEEPEFKKFIQLLNSEYNLPTRKTLSNNLLPALYKETLQTMRSKILTLPAVSLTTESWLSNDNRTFYSVTAHYFVNDNLSATLLDCSEFPERQTAKTLSQWLNNVIKEWGLGNKVTAITTDNAVITSALRHCDLRHIGCYAHSLNLVVQKALLVIEPIIKKVRFVVQFFKKSNYASKLADTQKCMDLPKIKLKQDIPSQWNSTYDMFDVLIKGKEAIISTMEDLNADDKIRLTSEEWEVLEEISKILSLFLEVTKEISFENKVTISKISILSNILIKKISLLIQKHPQITEIKKVFLDELKNKFGNLEEDPFVAQAILMDPRFKSQGFQNAERYQEAQKALVEKVKELTKPEKKEIMTPEDMETQSTSSWLWVDFDHNVKKMAEDNPIEEGILEVDKYIAEPICSRNGNPLQWWAQRKAIFPQLYAIALKSLCVRATSISCEKINSKEWFTLSEKRNRLTTDKVKEIVFLASNL